MSEFFLSVSSRPICTITATPCTITGAGDGQLRRSLPWFAGSGRAVDERERARAQARAYAGARARDFLELQGHDVLLQLCALV